MSELQAAVDVDRIAREYAPGVPPGDEYRRFLAKLTTKAAQEALDGAELK
jgi:hypothetical protein